MALGWLSSVDGWFRVVLGWFWVVLFLVYGDTCDWFGGK